MFVEEILSKLDAGEMLAAIVERNRDVIAAGVLARSIDLGPAPEGAYAKEWNINGETATLSVRRA